MNIVEVGPSKNKLLVPHAGWSLNGWNQHASMEFLWGKTVVEQYDVAKLGEEVADTMVNKPVDMKGRGVQILNKFRLPSAHRDRAEGPKEEDVAGIAMVLYAYPENDKGRSERHHPVVLVHRELEEKLTVGKEKFDWSLPAETRYKRETLAENRERLFKEEVGIYDRTVYTSLHVIGHYIIRGAGEMSSQKVWIQAEAMELPWSLVQEHAFGSVDGQTDLLTYMPALLAIGGLPWRAGMQGILCHWLTGNRNVVSEGSSPLRESSVRIRNSSGAVVDHLW